MKRTTHYHTHTRPLPPSFLRIDLHGQNRWNARKTLYNSIIRLLAQQKAYLLVIHGYRHGTVLKDYIRSGRFSCDLKKEFPLLPPITVVVVHEGASKILFSEGVIS